MVRIAFSTAVHERPLGRGGEIVLLDWGTQTVEAVQPIDPAGASSPRQVPLGYRGLRLFRDGLVVARYSSLHVLGPDLRPRRTISHRLMADLHEIAPIDQDRALVSSTALDCVLDLDLSSGEVLRAFWPREMSALQTRWRLVPMTLDKTGDHRSHPSRGAAPFRHRLLRRAADRTPRRFWSASYARSRDDDVHVNAVAYWRGHPIALLAGLGAVVDLDARRVLIEDRRLIGAHNLTLLADGETLAINDTVGRTIRFYDLQTHRQVRVIELRAHSWIKDLERVGLSRLGRLREIRARIEGRWNQFVTPLQQRGLAAEGDYIWIGLSPAAIARFDVSRGCFVDGYIHSDDLRHRVNSLAIA